MMAIKRIYILSLLILMSTPIIFVESKTTAKEYVLVNTSLNWSQAETYCVSNYEGHLASIHSASENSNILSIASGNVVWIGLSDEGSDGIFWWISGDAFDYSNWASGQPNGGVSETVVRMGTDGTWYDIVASNTYRSVC
ncbi:MAG: C-type lectin domain-containing protein, partial [Candidatus Hodarchaeales archaeon]